MFALALQVTNVSGRALRSIRKSGLRATLEVAVASVLDLTFDWRYGTETRRVVWNTDFEAGLENRDHAFSYQATKAKPFLDLMLRLPLPPRSTFVDVGSGKGKVLLLASQLPTMARVVGLELSPLLCEQARRNVRIFEKSGKLRAPILVIAADASSRVPEASENVFFLYNPFDGTVLSAFLLRLRESLAASPRQVWILYSVPVHAAVLDASDLVFRIGSHALGGNQVHVYSNE